MHPSIHMVSAAWSWLHLRKAAPGITPALALLAAILMPLDTAAREVPPATGPAAQAEVGDPCPPGGVLLGVRGVGLALGSVPSVSGIRLSLRDRCVDRVRGLAMTLLPPPRMEQSDAFRGGEVRGLFLGTAPVARTLDGVALGLAALVAEDRLTGVGLGGVAVVSGGALRGAHLGGVAVVSQGALQGVQGAGVALVSEGPMRGIQAAGIAVVSEGSIDGLHLAGVAVVSEGPMHGIQAAGIAVVSGTRLDGIKVASVVAAPELRGISIGGVNRFEAQVGLAVGFYNRADRLRGVQIGLLNRADSNPAPFRILPVLNAGF